MVRFFVNGPSTFNVKRVEKNVKDKKIYLYKKNYSTESDKHLYHQLQLYILVS